MLEIKLALGSKIQYLNPWLLIGRICARQGLFLLSITFLPMNNALGSLNIL